MRLYELIKQCITNIRPIKYGGTGATTASGARKNLAISSIFLVNTLTTSITISASATATASINAAKSGYTTLGIVGWSVGGSASSFARVYDVSLLNGVARLFTRNTYTSSVTWTVKITMLYVKND
ncbi:MAG: hypothetical protein Q4C46_05465 [Bacillota bacterium]|nr:hypothetical protein [Bacillota bacterium]